jgi:hypothetical protein
LTRRAEIAFEAVRSSRTSLQVDQAGSPESLSRSIPAPRLIAEAHATLFGDRNRILELDEAALRMRHRGLDGEDHVGFQRQRCNRNFSPRLAFRGRIQRVLLLPRIRYDQLTDVRRLCNQYGHAAQSGSARAAVPYANAEALTGLDSPRNVAQMLPQPLFGRFRLS